MFSSRLDWPASANAIAGIVAEKQRTGVPLFDLTESNPTRAGIPYDREAIMHALGDPAALTYEPSPFGLEAAREAVASHLGVAASRLILTASTSEAYSFLFKLLADPGDTVLVPQPSYPLFEYLARLDSVGIEHYPLRYHEGWWLDTRTLGSVVGERSRAVVIVNPNNPTGSYIKTEELERLTAICAERKMALISDEVFFPFRLQEERTPSAQEATECLTFTLGGLSKLLGLPQMKLGWIYVSGPAELVERAMERLELIADSYLSVSAPVQHAVGRWLELQPAFLGAMLERLRGNLAYLQKVARPLRVEGGWYATVPLARDRSEEEWAIAALREADVLIQPGYFYDLHEEHARGPFAIVSLLTAPQIFEEGIRRLLDRGGL